MSSEKIIEAQWWESAEDHRFALEVLQLPLRRKMLKIIAGGTGSIEQIAEVLALGLPLAQYHLQMLEKALVIEQTQGGWIATSTGLLYLKHVEAKS